MKLTGEQACHIVEENHAICDEWTMIGDAEIYTQDRWNSYYKSVHRHEETGKHYQFHYVKGSTENQLLDPYEYDKEYEPEEVEWKEVKIMSWLPVDK